MSASVTEILLRLESIEMALEELNAVVKGSEEFRELADSTIWNQEINLKASRDKEKLHRMMEVFEAYYSVWNLMTRSPLGRVSLVPVERFHRKQN